MKIPLFRAIAEGKKYIDEGYSYNDVIEALTSKYEFSANAFYSLKSQLKTYCESKSNQNVTSMMQKANADNENGITSYEIYDIAKAIFSKTKNADDTIQIIKQMYFWDKLSDMQKESIEYYINSLNDNS